MSFLSDSAVTALRLLMGRGFSLETSLSILLKAQLITTEEKYRMLATVVDLAKQRAKKGARGTRGVRGTRGTTEMEVETKVDRETREAHLKEERRKKNEQVLKDYKIRRKNPDKPEPPKSS